ncbi:MAG TPA: MbcA/ParS/Xre antitoxin family protein [Bryobacteraceae bacterium]|nr:MbcA/ParS/Xre antitoxin family protein [Bryobacteraceae bacterium]
MSSQKCWREETDQEIQTGNTQLNGTVRLPDGPRASCTVNIDWRRLEEAGLVSASDSSLLRAIEVFGKTEKALDWLNAGNPLFSGKTPRAMADSDDGKKQVLGVLFDLEHGFPA